MKERIFPERKGCIYGGLKNVCCSIGKQQNSFPSIIHAQNNFFHIQVWDSAFFFIRIITTFIESFPWLTVFFAVWGWKLRYFCFMSATDWQLWLWLWSRLSVWRHSSCQQSPFSLTPRNLFFIKLSLDVTTSTLSNSCDKALNFSKMKSSK